MNAFLLHHYFEWNVHFTYANNLGFLDLFVSVSLDSQAHSAFSTTCNLWDSSTYLFPFRLTVKRIPLSARHVICVFAYILLRNKTLLFPKWRQKPTRPILRYSSVVNTENGELTNFKNSYKINKNSNFLNNFFALVIREKRKFILAEKNFWG